MTEVCASKCPHGTKKYPDIAVRCHLERGHSGGHESLGPPSPGHRPSTVCRWEQ